MSGLAYVGQDDFGVGVLRGVAPDTQPGVGLYNAVNGLYNDDGDVYRRGGDAHYTPDDFGAPMTFIWSGFLGTAASMLAATASGCFDGQTGVAITGPGVNRPMLPAVVGSKLYLPNGQSWTGVGNLVPWVLPALPSGTRHVCAAAGRLLAACGNRIAFSTAPPDAFAFNATDYHELPGGVVVMGMMALRDTAFIFTNFGLWTIANLAFDLTDAQGNPQQTLQLITPELSLWDESGLCEWEGRLVAPCTDRVYLIDGISAPQPISDSIAPFYMRWVRGGYRPGGAKVFRNHLFLPILDRATLTPQTLLVCRLNRPARARYLYFPWSTFTGHPAGMVSGDVSLLSATPKFLLAHSDGQIAEFTDVFNPSEQVALDTDDAPFEFDVETRDFPTGNGQPNHIREVRLRYTLDGHATVTAGYSYGSKAQLYKDLIASGQTYAQVDAAYPNYEALLHGPGWTSGLPTGPDEPERFWTVLGDLSLSEPGLDPARWRLVGARRVRFARLRFRTEDAPNSLIIHHVDMGVRPAAHQR
jgi:hypothetical protein